MKKRQVLILWVVAIALGGGVAAVKLSQSHTTGSATQRKPGETLLPSFPAQEVAAIDIQGAADSVSIVKKEGQWIVPARGNFPANATFVNSLLRAIGEVKVTRGLEAGSSFAPRFGMDEAATKPAEHGLTATFKDAGGKEIVRISLGKTIEGSAAEPSPMAMGGGAVGRYIRNHADSSGFYAVSEMFPSVTANPKRWLADSFISPEKIKTITVTEAGKTAAAWKLTRESAEAEFKLDGAKPAEVLDTTATSPLKGLFSYARFEDVIPADKVAEKTVPDQQRTATLETFDGFTYVIHLSPAKPEPAPITPVDPEAEPPAQDNFLITVDVTAELPKERVKPADEKPEEAKAKDEEFAAHLKTLEEKAAKEKAFAGITFEVGKSLVDPLLKERGALITQATPPAAPGAQGAPIQQFPGGMIARPPVTATTPPIEAVTPPIQVPPADQQQDAPKGEDSGE